MSPLRTENRLAIHLDIKGKRLELSAAGVTGVMALFGLVVLCLAILSRML